MSGPTHTPLASTAMEAAREITHTQAHLLKALGRNITKDWFDNETGCLSAIIQKHFQPLLAKVEGEREAATLRADCLQKEVTAWTEWREKQPWLAEIRSYQDQLTALRADLVAAKEERDALKYWKASALEVESTWDCQAVGKLIGATLGSSIRPQIQPAIEKLKADLAAKEAALNQALKKLRHVKKETENGVVYWETYAFESELLAIEARASRADKGGT